MQCCFSDKANAKSGNASKSSNGVKPVSGSKSGNLSDDEPLYDSVCSDEDYASIGDNQSLQDGNKTPSKEIGTNQVSIDRWTTTSVQVEVLTWYLLYRTLWDPAGKPFLWTPGSVDCYLVFIKRLESYSTQVPFQGN